MRLSPLHACLRGRGACGPGGKAPGFTLIELLVAMIIVGILTAIAVPSYLNYVRKARRVEAKTALLDLAGREERFYASSNVYTTTPASVGYSGASFPMAVGNGYYSISVAVAAGPPATFTLIATPVAGKGQDLDTPCASLTVTQTGSQTARNSAAADNTATCWNQ